MDVCNSCAACITHMNIYEESMLPRMRASPHNIDWCKLCADPREWMLPLMIENRDQIWWAALFNKPCCMTSTPGIKHNLQRWMLPLLMTIEDPNEIDWCTLHLPSHFRPWMLPFMKKHQDQLNWSFIIVEPWMAPLNPPRVAHKHLCAPSSAKFDDCRCSCFMHDPLDKIDGLQPKKMARFA